MHTRARFGNQDSWRIELQLANHLHLITHATLCYYYAIDHLYFLVYLLLCKCSHSLLLSQLHNPCLLYWLSPAEYIQAITLYDLKFC